MYRNFRSQLKLLQLQNEIVKILEPASVIPEEQAVGDEGEIQIHPFQNSEEEADYLSEKIDIWINEEKVPPSEIAILIKN